MSSKDDRLSFEVDEDTATAFRALSEQYDTQGECLRELLEEHAESMNDSAALRFFPRRRDRL